MLLNDTDLETNDHRLVLKVLSA